MLVCKKCGAFFKMVVCLQVFCSMNHILKEQNKDILSRLQIYRAQIVLYPYCSFLAIGLFSLTLFVAFLVQATFCHKEP